MTQRGWWALGCAFAFLAVAAGAFGAHALRSTLPPERLAIWETGARYQIYHALALLLATQADSRWPGTRAAAWAFTVGIVLFSGSLYLLAVTGIRWLGAVTPLGGVGFLVGWVLLGVARWRAPAAA